MKKILIIEDEIPARNKLKRFISELDEPTQITSEIDTVANAIEFLRQHEVDLIFSDIELLDGNAFEIYDQVNINCPIIFTTAYDQFWMNAFDSNGIAYLLKPFSKQRFQQAWNKYLMLSGSGIDENNLLKNINELIHRKRPDHVFKKRFTIHSGQSIYFLDIADITHFEAEEAVVFSYDIHGNKHLLTESTLKRIEEQIDPCDFFRINRSEIIAKQHIEKIERYNKNTLAIKLKKKDIYLRTSQSNTPNFRKWMEK